MTVSVDMGKNLAMVIVDGGRKPWCVAAHAERWEPLSERQKWDEFSAAEFVDNVIERVRNLQPVFNVFWDAKVVAERTWFCIGAKGSRITPASITPIAAQIGVLYCRFGAQLTLLDPKDASRETGIAKANRVALMPGLLPGLDLDRWAGKRGKDHQPDLREHVADAAHAAYLVESRRGLEEAA